jgi:hypothetical protein
MRLLLYIGLLVCVRLYVVSAQDTTMLTDSAQISLLTGSAGRDLYSIFGHSAVRVYDPIAGLDKCYNYGTFDFDQPDFYTLFLRGKLLYFLNPEPFRATEYGFRYEERNLQEQILGLDQHQKQALFDLLEENLQEANRYYLYDFFYDNCATRIRDIISRLFGGAFRYSEEGLPLGSTMRYLLHEKLQVLPWTRFGIDLLLGAPADRVARPGDFMFLPDYMHDIFARTRLPDGSKLVALERQIPETPFPPPAVIPPFYRHPWFALSLLSVIGLFLVYRTVYGSWVETALALVLGLSGCLLLFMWVGTDHMATKNNWNLIWALPTHLIFGLSAWRRWHRIFAGGLAWLTLLAWTLIPQQLPVEMVPLLVLIAAVGWKAYRSDAAHRSIDLRPPA